MAKIFTNNVVHADEIHHDMEDALGSIFVKQASSTKTDTSQKGQAMQFLAQAAQLYEENDNIIKSASIKQIINNIESSCNDLNQKIKNKISEIEIILDKLGSIKVNDINEHYLKFGNEKINGILEKIDNILDRKESDIYSSLNSIKSNNSYIGLEAITSALNVADTVFKLAQEAEEAEEIEDEDEQYWEEET